MSLRDLGVFSPLEENHPGVGETCWICERQLGVGTRVALKPFETSDQTGSSAVEAKLICATCLLKGEEIMTEGGRRIVERIKDGDASPFPVETTDGLQWSEEEVSVVKEKS